MDYGYIYIYMYTINGMKEDYFMGRPTWSNMPMYSSLELYLDGGVVHCIAIEEKIQNR